MTPRNRFHSLCPYFAMFPEMFVETWINRLTKRGQVVLDPFCGRGTTPFQSLLMGRRTIACDVNPVAFCITRAKTSGVTAAAVRRRITQLESEFTASDWNGVLRRQNEFFRLAFSAGTLRQLLFLRSRLAWSQKATDCMVAALTLGSLHGESQKSTSYLSNQMPRTISTKPGYSVRFWRAHGYKPPRRDLFQLLRDMVAFRFQSDLPGGDAIVLNDDMRQLPSHLLRDNKRPKHVITSPPYFDVTNFEEDQWLRLWFLGGPAYPTRGRVSRDDRYVDAGKYWSFIADMWRMLGQVLARKANVVIRLGTGRVEADQLMSMMKASASFCGRQVELVFTDVSPLQRRQTDAFRPGSRGCRYEIDFHFRVA